KRTGEGYEEIVWANYDCRVHGNRVRFAEDLCRCAEETRAASVDPRMRGIRAKGLGSIQRWFHTIRASLRGQRRNAPLPHQYSLRWNSGRRAGDSQNGRKLCERKKSVKQNAHE